MDTIIRDLKSTRYLFDDTAGLLSDIYEIKFLVLETAKSGNVAGVKQVQPPYTQITGDQYSDGIMIINLGNGHFEVIGKLVGANTKYIFKGDSGNANVLDELDMLNPFNKNF
jgi:hypothetical protein